LQDGCEKCSGSVCLTIRSIPLREHHPTSREISLPARPSPIRVDLGRTRPHSFVSVWAQARWVSVGHFHTSCRRKIVFVSTRFGMKTSSVGFRSPTHTYNSNPHLPPSGSNPTASPRRRAARRRRDARRGWRRKRRASSGTRWRPGAARSRRGDAHLRRRAPSVPRPPSPPLSLR
jgi:hypothetical protein